MKIIARLSDDIERKIEQAECDIKTALELKDEFPTLAETYFKIASQELADMGVLHTHVASIIEDYKKKKGDPPEGMKLLYEILHKKHIQHTATVKSMLSLYKE